MIKSGYRRALIGKIDAKVKEGEITSENLKTSYFEAGDGEAVILLHGGGAGGVTWYPSVGAISKEFRVIVPDIIGYGESDKPDGAYDRPYFSRWLHRFLESLRICNASIVGLSQGGAVALQFALDYPGFVNKLALVDSGALGAKPSFWPMVAMIWMNVAPSRLANWFFSRFLLFNPSSRDPNHSHYSIEVLKRAGGKTPFSKGRGRAVSEIPEHLLRGLENETLIVWGENDRLFSIEFGEKAARVIPNSKMARIPKAGHLPHIDQPEIFNEVLLGFLKQ